MSGFVQKVIWFPVKLMNLTQPLQLADGVVGLHVTYKLKIESCLRMMNSFCGSYIYVSFLYIICFHRRI